VQPKAVDSAASIWMRGKLALRSFTISRTSATISGWVLRMLLMRCGSLTDTGMVIRSAPASKAMRAYFRFGTSTAMRSPRLARAASTTSAQSAICGSTLGDTKEPTSISGMPAVASAATQRALSAVGIMRLMLCNPSRGPTSLIVTSLGFIRVSPVSRLAPL
jgi:hypothetical protein